MNKEMLPMKSFHVYHYINILINNLTWLMTYNVVFIHHTPFHWTLRIREKQWKRTDKLCLKCVWVGDKMQI